MAALASRGALGQAFTVVVLSSAAAGVGLLVSRCVAGVLSALLGWLVWSGLTWFIGTRLLGTPSTRADSGELLRTTGFA